MWLLMDRDGSIGVYAKKPEFDGDSECWTGKPMAYGMTVDMFGDLDIAPNRPVELLSKGQWRKRMRKTDNTSVQVVYDCSGEDEAWLEMRYNAALEAMSILLEKNMFLHENIIAERSVKIANTLMAFLKGGSND